MTSQSVMFRALFEKYPFLKGKVSEGCKRGNQEARAVESKNDIIVSMNCDQLINKKRLVCFQLLLISTAAEAQ